MIFLLLAFGTLIFSLYVQLLIFHCCSATVVISTSLCSVNYQDLVMDCHEPLEFPALVSREPYRSRFTVQAKMIYTALHRLQLFSF